MAAHDRILGSEVTFTLSSDAAINGLDGTFARMVAEVDKCDIDYVPTFLKTWPAGNPSEYQQLAGAFFRVTLEGAQLGGGMVALGKYQLEAHANHDPVPKLKMTRKYRDTDGTVISESYSYGVVTDAKNTQGAGNVALTTSVTIEFEKHDDEGISTAPSKITDHLTSLSGR